ncbi:MAG: class I SAM-dependent methyltransferase [Gammaproteobacteria bacterium]|nr:class I SAM-dependent methyltransferase [Gammaproteobacteria bacterium]
MRFLIGVENRIRQLRRRLSPLLYAGTSVYCPFCDRTYRSFRPAGRRKFRRPNAVCAVCGSRERDRLMHEFLHNRKDLSRDNAKLLHIAPEACLRPAIADMGDELYLSCDLLRRDVDIRLNIEQMPFTDQFFDIVFCSHVLPEVEHDESALAEIHRVLNPEGWALVSVPSMGESTTSVQPGDEHEAPPEFFRIYGDEFSLQLVKHGFDVERIDLNDVLDQEQQSRMRIDTQTASAIYLLRRQANVELD